MFYEKVRAFLVAIHAQRPVSIPAEQVVRKQARIDGILDSAEVGRGIEMVIPDL